MPFHIIRQDITKMEVDAIVNATDPQFSASGGADLAIHQAAGEKLRQVCEALGTCRVGEIYLTEGFALPARYILHTVSPTWQGGDQQELTRLADCYESVLSYAVKTGIESIAFPLISSGSGGFPKEAAFQVARRAILRFLQKEDSDLTVYLAVYDKESLAATRRLTRNVAEYINDNDITVEYCRAPRKQRLFEAEEDKVYEMAACPEKKRIISPDLSFYVAAKEAHEDYSLEPTKEEKPTSEDKRKDKKPATLSEYLAAMDRSFSEKLLMLIDEKGLTDVACYKKANISRKLFSKIRSDPAYRPTKQTAVAFAVALELTLDETQALLAAAGYTLSRSSKFDLIIRYCLENRILNVFTINELLFSFDQLLLGGVAK